jgi:hypothetical protein
MAKTSKTMGREMTEDSGRGVGVFALLAILTVVGILIWFVVNNSGETT